jgi:hypothetical protein
MRELGGTKGLPFLEALLDGKIYFVQVGACTNCGKESEPTDAKLKQLRQRIRTSVGQRLKALEQAWKYGLGTRNELTPASPKLIEHLTQQVAVITNRHSWSSTELLDALDGVWK